MSKPPREFSESERHTVRVLAGMGMAHSRIAVALSCSEKTLRKHCRAELDAGSAALEAECIAAVVDVVRNGPAADRARNAWRLLNGRFGYGIHDTPPGSAVQGASGSEWGADGAEEAPGDDLLKDPVEVAKLLADIGRRAAAREEEQRPEAGGEDGTGAGV